IRRIQQKSPHYEGKPDPQRDDYPRPRLTTLNTDLKLPPPPPPRPRTNPEKGVRIDFDPAALDLAAGRQEDFLPKLENRLLAARSAEELRRALSWTDEELARQILSQGQVTTLSRVRVVSLQSLVASAA